MQQRVTLFTLLLFFSITLNAFDPHTINPKHLPHDYLSQYYLDDTGQPEIHYLDSKKYPGVTQYDFLLYSVNWPDRHSQWQHRLSIFMPDKSLHKEALLFINGGINQPIREDERDPYESPIVPYFNAYYARKLHAPIITFFDVPNQYIRLNDNIDRKEDDLIANAWRQFITEPNQWLWPPHLPMAKATSIAMDAIEKAAKPLKFKAPKGYVLSGVSKRGWASWLTMLADQRVVGIIPAVNEILDVQNTIQFIKKSITYWPPAFHDYLRAGIHHYLDHEKFLQLLNICDPYRYKDSPQYQKRFNLPKYIIRTSGDDFFTPDCQNNIDILEQSTHIRVLPNQGHRLNGKTYAIAAMEYFAFFLKRKPLPKLTEHLIDDQLSHVSINQDAKKVILWQAHNPNARDFRYSNNIRYEAINLSQNYADIGPCLITLPNLPEKKGFYARFLEVRFNNLTLTTKVHISPDTFISPLHSSSPPTLRPK